jgi:ubiquinone biosynthesis protein UbiJ
MNPLDWPAAAFRERALLALNHLLSAEPAARERLKLHAGRPVSLVTRTPGAPPLLLGRLPLPSLPQLDWALVVTPAGLFEEAAAGAPGAAGGLRIEVDLTQPAQLLSRLASGQRPEVRIDGPAAFAADISWLIDNLRWDAEGDLARVIGDVPARTLSVGAARAKEALGRVFGAFVQPREGRPSGTAPRR